MYRILSHINSAQENNYFYKLNAKKVNFLSEIAVIAYISIYFYILQENQVYIFILFYE